MVTPRKPKAVAASTPAQVADETPSTVEKNPRNAAYGAAMKALREEHQEEFEGYLAAELAARGLEYRRRLNLAERAEIEAETKRAAAKAKLDAILEAFPELAEPVAAQAIPASDPFAV